MFHRWQKVLNPNLIKGPWTPEEDAKVKALVKELGPKKWSVIASIFLGASANNVVSAGTTTIL